MRTCEMITNFFDDLFRGSTADFWLGASAETFRDLHAHLDDALGTR